MNRSRTWIRAFRRDEDGATLVEFGIVLAIFLLIFFGLIDFGRMAFHYVTAEKAMHVATRVAVVRPAACPGLPQTNLRGPVTGGAVPPNFGTSCSVAADICARPATVECQGAAANPTVAEIWALIEGALPNDATPANLHLSYSHDGNLGFLGGPYVPVVTVELRNLDFTFVSPLGSLVALAGGGTDSDLGGAIPFPSMSVSLPAEDLAMGAN